MTPDETTGEHAPTPSPDVRPPRGRLDPAAMRETLDAARRRLGPPGPSSTMEHSAKELRALLREAAADQAVPQDHHADTAPDPEPSAVADEPRSDDTAD